MKSMPLFRSDKAQKMIFIFGASEISPVCSECDAFMTITYFLDLELVPNPKFKNQGEGIAIFQCQDDPGMCDDWDANSGANAAELCDSSFYEDGMDGLITKEGLELNDDEFSKFLKENDSCVGKLGGRPLWIQGDETPSCKCGDQMEFVGQVYGFAHEDLNYGGGGCGYTFMCPKCEEAKFLWQS